MGRITSHSAPPAAKLSYIPIHRVQSMQVRNVKLILVLLLLGIALMVVGAARINLGDQGGVSAPASPAASWITGLVGLALVASGAFLLGKRSLEVRLRQAASPPSRTLRPVQGFAIVAGAIAAVAAVAFGSSMVRSQASSQRRATHTPAREPVASDRSSPAPTPDMPKSYQPK